jgi:transcriptional regulator
MYTPSAFKIENPEKIAEFIQENSFATIISRQGDSPFASHLPLLFDVVSNRLIGHMARGNPQWQHFSDGRELLAIFHGPHAYVSPKWYQTAFAVPTWNYAVVHVYGQPHLIEDECQIADIVKRTVRFYEGNGPDAWHGRLPAEFEDKLMKAIVGFEIAITRIEAKFKLGQNRPKSDIAGVYTALSHSPHAHERSLAAFMREQGMVE